MSRSQRAAAELGLAAGVIAVLMTPAYIGRSWFGRDYSNHLWLVGYQAQAISHNGYPTLFLHTSNVYEPFYAFYGATLYAISGYLTLAVGSQPHIAFVLMLAAGLAMAYGGTWWLSHLLGVAGWWAHVPAIVAVTSPYLLTDLFARAAFTEFMALCAIPLVVAGVIAALQTQRWRAGPFAALLIGVVILTGSHNITLLWSAIVFGLVAVVLLAVFFKDVVRSRARLLQVIAVVLLGVGINAWFLALDVRYQAYTMVGATGTDLHLLPAFNTFGALFTPLRTTAPGSTTPGLTVAAPVVALAWAVVVAALAWRGADVVGRKLFAVIGAALVATVAVIMCPPFWHSVGTPFTLIQFPYRLNGYVLLFTAGLVIVALRMGRARFVRDSVIVVLVLSAVPAVWQEWHIGASRATGFLQADDAFQDGYEAKPTSWYDGGSYADASAPIVVPGRQAVIAAAPPGSNPIEASVTIPPGSGPVALNVEGGAYVVAVRGAIPIGRTAAGNVVIAQPDNSAPRVIELTVAKASNKTMTFAPIITLVCALLAIVCWLGLLLRDRVAVRHRRGARPPRERFAPVRALVSSDAGLLSVRRDPPAVADDSDG